MFIIIIIVGSGRSTQNKTGKRKVDYQNIEKEVRDSTCSCCSNRCIQTVLTISDIYKTSDWFLKKSREVQGHLLLNFFQVSHRSKGQRTINFYDHNVEKKTVCQKA